MECQLGFDICDSPFSLDNIRDYSLYVTSHIRGRLAHLNEQLEIIPRLRLARFVDSCVVLPKSGAQPEIQNGRLRHARIAKGIPENHKLLPVHGTLQGPGGFAAWVQRWQEDKVGEQGLDNSDKSLPPFECN
jgi:hypothetical protein